MHSSNKTRNLHLPKFATAYILYNGKNRQKAFSMWQVFGTKLLIRVIINQVLADSNSYILLSNISLNSTYFEFRARKVERLTAWDNYTGSNNTLINKFDQKKLPLLKHIFYVPIVYHCSFFRRFTWLHSKMPANMSLSSWKLKKSFNIILVLYWFIEA